jgi:unsaturated rhamnogalacturonyl hydrolase
MDPATGLLRHAWDESRNMFWANPETGQSDHAWGRALGWYMMALVDVLDWVPENHPAGTELKNILCTLLDKLQEYDDPATGMWYQVLDCPGREGNYIESTCSAMFTYTYLKAADKGYAPQYKTYARKLYRKLVKTFIREEKDGTITLTECCAVAGLGGKENRRGDYDYYINEKKCDNDPKGVGPFIWASLIYEK